MSTSDPRPDIQLDQSESYANAQRATLASCLLKNDCVEDVFRISSPDDFEGAYRIIAATILTMSVAGQAVDMVTLSDTLAEDGKLSEVGGRAAISTLSMELPSAANFAFYAEIVKKHASEKRERQARRDIALIAADSQTPFREAIAKIRKKADELDRAGEDDSRGFHFVPIEDLELRKPEYVVGGLIEADSTGMIVGPVSSLKTFIAVSLNCCVATGTPFFSRPVRQGPVFMIIGEGRSGIMRRLRAWEIANHVSLDGIPIFVSSMPAALAEPDFAVHVASAIEPIVEKYGPPALITVDTLARNFGPGRDENSSVDMSTFISSLDLFKSRWNCATLAIHHPGQAVKDRARGSYSLIGACDFAYLLDRDESGVTRMVCQKMKDAEIPDPLAFRFAQVDLGIHDDDGDEVTSGVVVETAYEPPARKGTEGAGKNQVVALEALDRLHGRQFENLEKAGYDGSGARVSVGDWAEECRKAGLRKDQSYHARKSLIDHGIVVEETGYVSRS